MLKGIHERPVKKYVYKNRKENKITFSIKSKIYGMLL